MHPARHFGIDLLCPERRAKSGKPEDPSEFELNHIRKDKAQLKVIRSRLPASCWRHSGASRNAGTRRERGDDELCRAGLKMA